jgi:hypothetical protein
MCKVAKPMKKYRRLSQMSRHKRAKIPAERNNVSYYYEFEDRHRILLVIVHGSVGENEFRELYFDIRTRKEEEQALTGILDLTGVTVFDIDSQIIRELASYPPNIVDPILRAVVAPTDLLFGMSRMFQIIGSETREQLHIVRTLDEALTLLNAKAARFHRLEAA